MKSHIEINRKEDCSGCKCCEQICPKHCISMQEDSEGFWYPEVNENECIHCGLCVECCPLNKAPELSRKLTEPEVFAATLKNKTILQNSSSGGLFSAFALEILKEGGVVFGCAFDENFKAVHIPILNADELYKLQGSKYVVSDLNNTYTQVRTFLSEGKKVLYSGSACHIAGLQKFLKNENENLLTLEILCHGTPSQKLFRKHLEYLSETYRGKILSYAFRDKSSGWGLNYKTKTKTKTKTIYSPADEDAYYASFLRGKTYRPSCYECHFAKQERIADITLGDFWGIELFHPEFYNKMGVSAVILNTEKAKAYWEKISDQVDCVSSSMKEVRLRNHNLNAPTVKPKCRDTIYDGIDGIPYSEFQKRLKLHGKEAVFSWIKNHLPKSLRLKINRLVFRLKGKGL